MTSVDRVEIDDGSGQVTTVDPSLWRLIPDLQRPVLAPKGGFWLPTVSQGGVVTITFSAGFGPGWDAVPADLAQAVLLLAARYHEDRSFEGSQSALPFGVSALIERWRSVRMLGGRGATRGHS